MLEVTYSTLLTLRTPDILTFDRLAVPNTCKLHVDTPLVLLIVVETMDTVESPDKLLKVDEYMLPVLLKVVEEIDAVESPDELLKVDEYILPVLL